MLKLRRVNEAKTMFEKGWDALVDFIKEILKEDKDSGKKRFNMTVTKKNGDGFTLNGPKRSSVHVSLNLKEAMDGVYTLSIDGASGRKWRLSDHEIINPKTGQMKLYDKKAQIENMLDIAKATIDKMIKNAESSESSEDVKEVDPKLKDLADKYPDKSNSNKKKDDSDKKTEGVRRLSRIRFI